MGTGKPRISTAAAEPAGRVVQVQLALGPVLAELGTARVLGQELAIAQVVGPELGTARVLGRELPIAQVVGQELERVPVAAVLGHPRGRLALALDQVVVALRIRLVTAAHPHDLVPLLAAAEDLAAAAAETTREPVATEAVIAWEVAE